MSKQTVSAAGGAMPAQGLKSRRTIFSTLAGIPALALLPTAAAVAKTADNSCADAHMVELDRRHAALAEAARMAGDAFMTAEASVRRVVGVKPRESVDYSRSDRSVARQLRAHDAAVAVHHTGKAKAEIDFRVAELRAAHQDTYSALSLLEREVWETPAVGLAGLRAKARMAQRRGSSLTYSVIQDLIAMEAVNG